MIKASDILERVKHLGQDHPDATRQCQYVNADGSGCCIVGTALIDAGVDPAPFLESPYLNEGTNVRTLFLHHAKELGLANDLSDDDLDAFRRAQMDQDMGGTWGEAVEYLP